MKKENRKITAVIMTLALVLSLIVVPSGQAQAAEKLKVTLSTKSIAVKQKVTIKTNVKATFKSSNKKVATVTSKGVVKGKKAGKAKITVTSKANKKQKKTIKITVNDLIIKSPAGAKASIKVAKLAIIKTNIAATFKSLNTNVATVSSNGVVRGVSAGVAVITVTSKKSKKLEKTVTITVTEDIKVPTTQQVVTEAPTTQQVVTETPTTQQVVTETPTTQQIVTEVPTTQQVITEAPTTQQVVTEAPTTQQVVTETPTTQQVTTEMPTTEQSTSNEVLEVQAKGKIPNSEALYNEGFIVYLKSGENNVRRLDYGEYTVKYIETFEENEHKYKKYEISYNDLKQSIDVETIDLPENLLYAVQLSGDYDGEELADYEKPDFTELSDLYIRYGNNTIADVNITSESYYNNVVSLGYFFADKKNYEETKIDYNNLYWGHWENDHDFDLVYDYYFEYEGNLFCVQAKTMITTN